MKATIEALVGTLIRDATGQPEPDAARVAEVVRFVEAQMGRMPRHLRLPIVVLTGVLGLQGMARRSPARQARLVAAWRRSRLGPRRMLIRFYESLVVYGWHA